MQPWWGSFIKNVALPDVGPALIVGFATTFAALMGMVMNFAFLFSGTTSTNPQLLLLEFILVDVGSAYAGYPGVDYWFRPRFRAQLQKLLGGAEKTARTTA